MNNAETEEKIKEFFELNYESMKISGGHSLTESVKQTALLQVLLYWKKLNELAKRITSTEEKLSLPDLTTPEGRKYTIEGIVDIVREDTETWLYDIKTHELEYIKSNKELYEQQLNVYAFIWQKLRNNPLNHTAVISTNVPDKIKFNLYDEKILEHFLSLWEPVIDMEYSEEKVEQTINEFSEIVDKISNNEFDPPSTEKLNEPYIGVKSHELFGTRVCRNCDARFSCVPFREFALGTKGALKKRFEEYYNDFGTDEEQEDWVNSNLNIDNIP